MVINKAYIFRLYPTNEQKELINKCIGSSRFVYNYYLNKKENEYKENKVTLTLGNMKKDLKNLSIEHSWLKEVDSMCLRTSLDDLDKAYINFFSKRSGYPKYKKKNIKDSYRTLCTRKNYKEKVYSNIEVDLKLRKIKLPKLGWIDIRGYRKLKEFPYKIFNATIERIGYKYYVCLSVEEEIKREQFVLRYPIGIDLGIKDLIVTSDGYKIKMENKIKVQEKRIRGLQRGLARCVRCSKNSYKIKMKIKRCYQKIRNMRKYIIHTITSKIVKENDLISVETLKVKEMIERKESKKNHLSKYITNASFSEVIRQLEYKSKWNNKVLIKINEYYPSSKKCNRCGYKNDKISDLSIRKWECPNCGNENDRDINASINILEEGIRLYYKRILN